MTRFEDLSLEVVLMVLSYVDSVSIASCITAMPFLKKYTVVVIHEATYFAVMFPYNEPMFYRIPGVEVRGVALPAEGEFRRRGGFLENVQLYDKRTDCFPIKLVECLTSFPVTDQEWSSPTLEPHSTNGIDSDPNFHTTDLAGFYRRISPSLRYDSTTFVHICYDQFVGSSLLTPSIARYCDIMDQYTPAKFHVWFSAVPSTRHNILSSPEDLASLNNASDIPICRGLRLLRIENVLHISDLQLEEVRSLDIDFPRIRGEERPSLKNIILDGSCHHKLTIGYYDRLPEVENITRSPQKDFYNPVLYLKNKSSPDFNRVPSSNLPLADDTPPSPGLVSLISNSGVVGLYGVPLALLERCDLRLLRQLDLVVSVREERPLAKRLFTPALSSLTVRVLVPGSVIPAFVRDKAKPRMKALTVSILAHDVSFDEFTGRSEALSPLKAYVYRSPALSVERPGAFVFQWKSHWTRILSPRPEQLTLIGFEMPFLMAGEHAVIFDGPPNRDYLGWISPDYHFRPFIPRSQLQQANYQLHFWVPIGTEDRHLRNPVHPSLKNGLFPILERSPAPGRRGALHLHDILEDPELNNSFDSGYSWVFGPEFEEYHLNGMSGEVEPAVMFKTFDSMPEKSEVEAVLTAEKAGPLLCTGVRRAGKSREDANGKKICVFEPCLRHLDMDAVTNYHSRWTHNVILNPEPVESSVVCRKLESYEIDEGYETWCDGKPFVGSRNFNYR